MQQQQVDGKPQGGLSWVYNDLPLSKFKALGIVQIVIGSLYLIVLVIASIGFYASYYNLSFAITVLGSGAAAIWTTQRRDKMLVIGTGLLALIAAIHAGIVVGHTVITLVMAFIVTASRSGYSSSSGYQSSGASVIALIIFIITFLVLVAELIVSIILALTTKRVVDNLQPVAPAGAAAPVTFQKV